MNNNTKLGIGIALIIAFLFFNQTQSQSFLSLTASVTPGIILIIAGIACMFFFPWILPVGIGITLLGFLMLSSGAFINLGLENLFKSPIMWVIVGVAILFIFMKRKK